MVCLKRVGIENHSHTPYEFIGTLEAKDINEMMSIREIVDFDINEGVD